jgi:hypothetical protein
MVSSVCVLVRRPPLPCSAARRAIHGFRRHAVTIMADRQADENPSPAIFEQKS